MKITVIKPALSHKAYQIAAETFADLAKKVADADCKIINDTDTIPDNASPVAVIGADFVNSFTAQMYLEQNLVQCDIVSGSDGYNIISENIDGRKFLFFSAGRPRAAIYAVYRYFELFCNCRWFWDGDNIKKSDLIFDNVNIFEEPRFKYRGLRYFAHRGLHRYHAEMWSFEDWKKEIDWILKKRMNFLMLRIGIDDIFQKAFPHIVSYPSIDNRVEYEGKGYDDRSLFWSLQFRGELRKKILEYAFDRDLIHPEDCGTMTHWYSRTPKEYLEKIKPEFFSQNNGNYSEQTGLVWNINKKENLEAYFKLTDTHIKEYGKPEIFHTIGLAERTYSESREENLRLKINTYRKISAYISEHYPNAPLLIASWDLWMFFEPDEVKKLLSCLDKKQCILFDYTSDTARSSNITNWGAIGNFPWIFGLFSGYAPNYDFRGNWNLIQERVKIAKADKFCKGFVFWPELSHGDTFALEYSAENSWNNDTLSIEKFTEKFCFDRYPETLKNKMLDIWNKTLPIISLRSWSSDDSFFQHDNDSFTYVQGRVKFEVDPEQFKEKTQNGKKYQADAVEILKALSNISQENPKVKRDVFDLAKTVITRYIDFALFSAEQKFLSDCDYENNFSVAIKLTEKLSQLLYLNSDYRLSDTMKFIKTVSEVNPNFEITIKHNTENTYCRSCVYENVKSLYIPEMKILFDEVKKSRQHKIDRENLENRIEKNRRKYYTEPLESICEEQTYTCSEIINRAAEIIESIKF